MIDWHFVLAQGLWILGLSIVLAAFSYHSWVRQVRHKTPRAQMADPACRLMLNVGLSLVALGFMLLRNVAAWERAAWGTIAMAGVWHGWIAWRGVRQARREELIDGGVP